jgi:hypothetical protein
MGFPMEMYQTPGHAIWVVSHKPVAVEAGLGHMGIHRICSSIETLPNLELYKVYYFR